MSLLALPPLPATSTAFVITSKPNGIITTCADASLQVFPSGKIMPHNK